jgi:hypothetical protein
MKYNAKATKAILFSILATASTAAFANHTEYKPTPTPTPIPSPYCPPTPTIPGGPSGGPSSVPEPQAWISFAIGAALIAGLTFYNRSKAFKARD